MSKLDYNLSILTNDEVKKIHTASLEVVAEVGVKIEHRRMLECLDEIGAKVDFSSMIVKFPETLVEECVRKQVQKDNAVTDGPELYADPWHLGSNKIVTEPLGLNTHIFCVNISDIDTGNIRLATLKDLRDSVIVANDLKNVRELGPLVVPSDVPSTVNDAYMWATLIKHSEKRVAGEIFNLKTIPFIREMCLIAAGGEKKFNKDPLIAYPCFYTGTLAFSKEALEIGFAVHDLGIPVRFGCTMGVAGMNSPVTLAGALTVANAESLASYVMAEAVGGNCIGSIGSAINFNQANGVTLYAGPEKELMSFAVRDIARFYGFKNWKHFGGHANASDSCYSGIQAGIEKGFSALISLLTDTMYMQCGMLSAEIASLQQMVIDDEICDMVNRFGRGIDVTQEKIACDLIKNVGIHGNYLDVNNDQSMEFMDRYFREENWLPKLFVRESSQKWQDTRNEMLSIAKERVKKILSENDPHPLAIEKEREIDLILKKCIESCV